MKVVPDIKSRRKHHVNIDNVTVVNPDIFLSQEQEMQKEEYEKIAKGGIYKKQHAGHVAQNALTEEERKNQFKGQALNRRAEQYGNAIKLVVIETPYEDKQHMMECAEVLDAILGAVEKGKKKLRLDFLPQKRILDHPKRWKKPELEQEPELPTE